MLEGTLTVRITKEKLLKTLTALAAKEFTNPYGETPCDVVATDLVEDKTTDEMAFTMTIERTAKPKVEAKP